HPGTPRPAHGSCEPGRILLHQLDDRDRRDRRCGTGPAAGDRRGAAAVGSGGRLRDLDRDLAGALSIMENVTGLLGLSLVIFAVSLFALKPDWGQLTHQALAPVIPDTESAATYWYYAIALFGAAMTPYEVFFFSSGAVEEKWTVKDLGTSRLNVLVGFPLGGILSVAIAACAAVVLLPGQIEVTSLSQITMPVLAAGGQLALAFTIVGIAAATFGAALETTLS